MARLGLHAPNPRKEEKMISKDAKFVRCISNGDFSELHIGKIYKVKNLTVSANKMETIIIFNKGDRRSEQYGYYRERFEEVTGEVVECIKPLFSGNVEQKVGDLFEVTSYSMHKDYFCLSGFGPYVFEAVRFRIVQKSKKDEICSKIARDKEDKTKFYRVDGDLNPDQNYFEIFEIGDLVNSLNHNRLSIKEFDLTDGTVKIQEKSSGLGKLENWYWAEIRHIEHANVDPVENVGPREIENIALTKEQEILCDKTKEFLEELSKKYFVPKDVFSPGAVIKNVEVNRSLDENHKLITKFSVESMSEVPASKPGDSVPLPKEVKMGARIVSLVRFGFWSFVGISSLVGCLSAIGLVALVNQWISMDQVQEFVDFLGWGGQQIATRFEQHFPWISGIGGTASLASFGLWVKRNFATWARTLLVWGFQVISETKQEQTKGNFGQKK